MIADTKAEDEFYRSMKPSNTTKKTGMGYSAAYPTMRRRSSASEGSLAKGEPEGTARGRARSVVFFSRSRESKSNRGKFSLGWLAGSVSTEVCSVFFFLSVNTTKCSKLTTNSIKSTTK